MWTPPVGVNLIALATRLATIWRIRVLSPRISSGTSGEQVETSSIPLTKAAGREERLDLADQRRQVQRPAFEHDLAGVELGEVEDVVDQVHQHVGALPLHVGQAGAPRLGKGRLAQHLGGADHSLQRDADLVAHLGHEAGLGSGRRLRRLARELERPAQLVLQCEPSAAHSETNTADRLIDIAICSAGSAVSSEIGPIEPGPRR